MHNFMPNGCTVAEISVPGQKKIQLQQTIYPIIRCTSVFQIIKKATQVHRLATVHARDNQLTNQPTTNDQRRHDTAYLNKRLFY